MRTLSSLIFAPFLCAAVIAAGVSSASAHARLVSSVPKDGATVAAGLAEIAFTFSRPLRLTEVRITQGKESKAIGPAAALSQDFQKKVTVSIPPLAAGSYEVSWKAEGEDAHVMKGRFSFTVSGEAPAKTAPEPAP